MKMRPYSSVSDMIIQFFSLRKKRNFQMIVQNYQSNLGEKKDHQHVFQINQNKFPTKTATG